MIGGADVRIRWLLDVQDRGAGKKLLAQDRAIRRSLIQTDAQQKRVATSASASGTKQVASSRQVVGARRTETKATSGLSSAVQRLNATQARSLATGAKVAATATRTAGAYDRQAAAANRAAAAERTRARSSGTSAVRGAGAGALAGGTAGSVAAGGARGGAVGLAVGVGVALQQTVAFDKAMRNVNSIAQLGEKRFQKLGIAVRDLGGRTAQMPRTLAEGLYDLVSSGFNARESLAILGKSARAATAGLTTTEVSTKAVAAVLNAYRMPASAAGQVSDELFRTVDRGVISFEELAQTVGDVLPFASSLGVRLHEVGAATATMTKAGIGAPETMTRIKNVMVSMLKPGEGLKAAYKDLGVESGEALIKQEGFQGALDRLVTTTDGSKAAIAELFPNIRSLGGALALTGANSRAAGKDLRGMEDASGATARALSQQSRSISFQWNKMKATASGVAIAIGTQLVPAASKAVQGIGRFVQGARDGVGVGGQFRSIIENVGSAIGGVASAVGPAVGGFLKLGLGVAEFASKLAASKMGVTLLTAAVGGLIGRFAGLALGGVIAGIVSLGRVLVMARIAMLAGASGMRVLSAAFVSSPIGAIAAVVGVVAGAILGMSHNQEEATTSANDLADANADLRDSYQSIRDLDLDAQGRRLAQRQATLAVTAAEKNLASLRRRGVGGTELAQAELALDQARLELKRSTRELNRTEGDHREERSRHIRQGNRVIAQAKGRVESIRDERDEQKKEVQELRRLIRITGGTKESKDRLSDAEDRLRGKTRELRGAQGDLQTALHRTGVGYVDPLTRKFEDLGLSLGNARRLAQDAARALADLDSAQQLTPLNELPRGRGNRRGGTIGFGAGGYVPSMVSPGEALRYPSGGWGVVPGSRTAADSVYMPLPSGTEVFTGHGQMLLSSGASRAAALSQQMPHFQRGGRAHTNYSAGRLSGLARWAGFPRGPAIVAGATGRGESTGDTLAHNTAGEDSRGLMQINVAPGANPKYRNRDLFNEQTNMRTALEIWRAWGRKFNAWSVYTHGIYRRHLASARRMLPWTGRGGRDGMETRTVKGEWRPTQGGVPKSRLDRYARRAYLQGLDSSAFQTGYQGGQEGYRRLINVEGIGALIAGARIEGSRPDKKVKRFTGSPAGPGTADAVVAAARRIHAARYAYQWGGGHGVSPIRPTMGTSGGPHRGPNPGYDCSGAVGRLLQEAGVPGAPSQALHSSGYGSWGVSGRGKRLTIHSTGDHVWTTIRAAAGNRGWGTSSSNPAGGPGWHPVRGGGVMSHPRGMRAGGVVGRRYRTAADVPLYERLMPFVNVLGGVLPGLRQGGVVRRFQGGGRATPVRETSGFFGRSGGGKLDMMLAQLRQLAAKANYDATLLLSTITEFVSKAGRITFRELVRTRRNLQREIRQLLRKGTTRGEEAQIKRLRAAIDVVNAEMGRRVGTLVRHQQGLARELERASAWMDRLLRAKGIDQASSAGVAAMTQFQDATIANLTRQQADLKRALERAKKAGDRAAIAEIRTQLQDTSDALQEAYVARIELVRAAITAAAQERVDAADFTASFRQGQLAHLDATQRLNRTADTPEGMRQRAAAVRGTIPALTAQRNAAYSQYIAATRVGDTAGARTAYLAAQAAATEITNALAEAAELIRAAAAEAAQRLVDTRQFTLDRAQGRLGRLQADQRLRLGGADSPAALREQAALIQRQVVPALAALRTQLYAQAQTLLSQGDTAGYRSALLAAESAGTELAGAMADAADLLKTAALTAAQSIVDTATHGKTMADLSFQRLELEQRLAGTYEGTGGALARADFIKTAIMPAIEAELAALRQQQIVAQAQGDPELARQIGEAVEAKLNEKLQAQLDAQEETAENTDKMAERMGSLSFEYGGQDHTDLVGSGTGV